jgi:tetratricopeptide (TPR) repeat protein
LNPRLKLLPSYLPSTTFLYSKNTQIYRQLIDTSPLPQSEPYYHQLFTLNPRENINDYFKLADYYFFSNNYKKLDKLLTLLNNNLSPQNFTAKESLPIAKIAYNLALSEWQKNEYQNALRLFQISLNLSKGWSHFHIELANAYWHTDQKDLAIKQLTVECHRFPKSIQYCQQYLDSNSQNFPKPGTKIFIEAINSLP